VARSIDGSPIASRNLSTTANERRDLVRIVGGLEPTLGLAPCCKGLHDL